MATPIPSGREGLIPHLVCSPCADAIEFYKRLGAVPMSEWTIFRVTGKALDRLADGRSEP